MPAGLKPDDALRLRLVREPPAQGRRGRRRSLAALAHVVPGVFEGHPFQERVLPHAQRVYLPTLKASAATSGLLMPLQFLSFRFLPVQLRVLSVNVVDLVWTAVVSFVLHGGDIEGARA